MIKRAIILGIVFMFLGGFANAATVNITFDDGLDSPDYMGSLIPDGYQGMAWNNMGYMTGTDLTDIGYDLGQYSHPNVAITGFYGGSSTMSALSGGPFYLLSAHLAYAPPPGTNGELLVDVFGYYNNNPVAYQQISVNQAGVYNFTTFSGIAVNSLTFHSLTGDLDFPVIMDNITLAAVPVPAGLLLLGSGLLGFLMIRKRISS
jgi:hypothetical protein